MLSTTTVTLLAAPLLPTIGMPELLIILVIVLIFFGVGKLPEIGKALGEGMRNFRSSQGDSSKDRPAKEIEINAEDAADVEEVEETVKVKSRNRKTD